jgi:regulator of protease activity HflC (stomatin/prohibitin superfamily)
VNTLVLTILLIVLVALAIVAVRWSVRTIPEATAGVVERSGRYRRTLDPGPHIVIPVIDRVRALIDLREQMLSVRPQQVLTSDQVKVTIEPVIYFRVTDPKAATYAVVDYISALQELTTTTLRAVAAGMDLETALSSANQFSTALMTELGHAARDWGLRVSRVELKALEPPSDIQEAIERHRRAELDKSADELRAQGHASSLAIRANAEAAAQAIRAHGEAERITKVFQAIEAIAGGSPDHQQLMLHILQMLSNRTQVGSAEVGAGPPHSQGFGLPPPPSPPDGSGTG